MISHTRDAKKNKIWKCEKLKELYLKYDILEYEEVFDENIIIERLEQIVKSELMITYT